MLLAICLICELKKAPHPAHAKKPFKYVGVDQNYENGTVLHALNGNLRLRERHKKYVVH